MTSQPPLLVVVDPAARRWDGESVRIARDVLCAGAPGVKVCLPESHEETERALARRGSRRPVIVGDDEALLRTVRLLYRERELRETALSVVPVGAADRVALARGLGVPADAVSAARTVLDGVGSRLGLLTDDSGGVVLGGLHIPDVPERSVAVDGDVESGGKGASGPAGSAAEERHVGRVLRELASRSGQSGRASLSGRSRRRLSLSRSVRAVRGVRGVRGEIPLPAQRLRIEADGELLADLDRPVAEVSVTPVEGTKSLAQVTVRPQEEPESGLVRVLARAVTVSGPDFRYRADALVGGPVRVRTWTAQAGAWSLTLPV